MTESDPSMKVSKVDVCYVRAKIRPSSSSSQHQPPFTRRIHVSIMSKTGSVVANIYLLSIILTAELKKEKKSNLILICQNDRLVANTA